MMKSIDFPEANLPLAKDQPQYQTLFVFVKPFPNVEMTTCFQLSEEEVAQIVETKKLWFTQLTFGRGFSPIRMSTMNPLPSPIITDKVPMDENRTPAEEWDKTHYINPNLSILEPGPCMNCNKLIENHFWSSNQCQL